MKVAVITTLYGKYGGTGRVTTEIIERYAADGNEIYVYCINYDEELLETSKIKKITKVPTIRRPGTLTLLSFTIMCNLIIKKKDFDIIYSAGDHYLFPDILTVHILRKQSRLTIQNLINKGLIKSSYSKFRQLLRKIYLNLAEIPESIIINNNNVKLIAVSKGLEKELLSNYKVNESRVITIENGIDISEYNTDNRKLYRDSLRHELGLSQDDFIILYVGSDWERKGLAFLIEALNKIDDAKLVILGTGDQKFFEYYAKKNNCFDRVIFLGYRKYSYKYYSIADIFVFPSLYETFGLVVLEAMASGVAVITTPVYGVEDFVKDGVNGYLVEYSSDRIAEKIIEVRKGIESIGTLCDNAVNTAKEYSWDKVYIKYKKIFDNYKRKI